MELFGIAASLPAAFVVTALYRAMLLKANARFRWISFVFKPASYIILGLFAVELVLMATWGVVQCRRFIGPLFFDVHMVVYFLGTPALANVFLLRNGPTPKWYFVCSVCAAFALVLVLIGFDVSEKLFGIDGTGGPFS